MAGSERTELEKELSNLKKDLARLETKHAAAVRRNSPNAAALAKGVRNTQSVIRDVLREIDRLGRRGG